MTDPSPTLGWVSTDPDHVLPVNGSTDPRSPNLADGHAISRQEFEAQWWQALEMQP